MPIGRLLVSESTWRAVASSYGFAAICNAVGIPSSLNPHGTMQHGVLARLIGIVNLQYAHITSSLKPSGY
jgi:hypothetical protein